MVLQQIGASRVGAEVRPQLGSVSALLPQQSALGPWAWCEVGLPSLCLLVTLPESAAPGPAQ